MIECESIYYGHEVWWIIILLPSSVRQLCLRRWLLDWLLPWKFSNTLSQWWIIFSYKFDFCNELANKLFPLKSKCTPHSDEIPRAPVNQGGLMPWRLINHLIYYILHVKVKCITCWQYDVLSAILIFELYLRWKELSCFAWYVNSGELWIYIESRVCQFVLYPVGSHTKILMLDDEQISIQTFGWSGHILS